jgi:dolichol-phosphate mannosyltransferase
MLDERILIPTLNEEETIGEVIDKCLNSGFEPDDILVVDGGSNDRTVDLAAQRDVRILHQLDTDGKGRAVMMGVEELIDDGADVVVMMDGDGTYRPEELDAMLAPIRKNRAEHVIGDRFAAMDPDAMSGLNRVGNKIINKMFSTLHGKNLQDILSGYRAFTVESWQEMYLTKGGFGIETEMAVECLRHNIKTEVVPVSYLPRPDGSNTNLHPISDGAVIIRSVQQLARRHNPLIYFGGLGAGLSGIGLITALWVAVEWVTTQTSHEVAALFSAFVILLGVQLMFFGFLADLVVNLHSELLDKQ